MFNWFGEIAPRMLIMTFEETYFLSPLLARKSV